MLCKKTIHPKEINLCFFHTELYDFCTCPPLRSAAALLSAAVALWFAWTCWYCNKFWLLFGFSFVMLTLLFPLCVAVVMYCVVIFSRHSCTPDIFWGVVVCLQSMHYRQTNLRKIIFDFFSPCFVVVFSFCYVQMCEMSHNSLSMTQKCDHTEWKFCRVRSGSVVVEALT